MFSGYTDPTVEEAASFLLLSIPYCVEIITCAEEKPLAWFRDEFRDIACLLCTCLGAEDVLRLQDECDSSPVTDASSLADHLAMAAARALRDLTALPLPESAEALRKVYGFDELGALPDPGEDFTARAGHAAWTLIHTLPYRAEALPVLPACVRLLVKLYPCEKCRIHAKNEKIQRAISALSEAEGEDGLAIAAFRLHNAVWQNIRVEQEETSRTQEKDALLSLEGSLVREELASILRAHWHF